MKAVGVLGSVLVICAALYLMTLSPSIDWGDGAELTTAAATLSIAHNPGYPVYTMLGKAFSLLPVGTVAYRLNLMSVFFSLLAVGLLAWLVWRITDSLFAGAVAALSFAFSGTYWSQTVITEVYTLNAFFLALGLVLLFVWTQGPRERRGAFYLFCATMGVGMGNHPLVAMLIPGAIYLLLRSPRTADARRLPVIGTGALLLLLGLSTYAYLPLRGLQSPPLNWRSPATWEGFWDVVLARANRGMIFEFAASELPGRLEAYAALLMRQFSLPGLALAIVGAVNLIRRRWQLTVVGLSVFLLNVLYSINYGIVDIEVYFIPSYFMVAIALGAGVRSVMAAVPRVSLGRWEGQVSPGVRLGIVGALLLLLPFDAATANLRTVDRSRDWSALDFARNTLRVVQPDSWIVCDWWYAGPLWYARFVEGERPDVTITPHFSAFKPADRLTPITPRALRAHPIYVAENYTRCIPGLRSRYYLDPVGPLFKVELTAPSRVVPSPAADTPGWRFANGATLLACRVDPPTAPQGGVVRLISTWRREATLRPSVAIIALDPVNPAQSRIWREKRNLTPVDDLRDWGPGQTVRLETVAFLPGDAPPGKYRVTTGVREQGRSALVSLVAPPGGPAAGRGGTVAVLGTVIISPREAR